MTKTKNEAKETGTHKAPELTGKQKHFNDYFKTAVDAQKVSCFWDGGDWRDRWELQDLYNLPQQEVEGQLDGFRSKVKSPEIVARNNSTMHKLKELNIGFVVRPRIKEAKLGAQIDQEVLNYYFKEGDFRKALDDVMFTAVKNGTGPVGVEWVKRVRDVHMPITKADDMDEEQKKNVKEGEVPYVRVTKVDYKGPALVPYDLTEIYFDPNATNCQGNVKPCDYVFVTRMMPKSLFEKEFTGKAGYKNVDKVVPTADGHQSQEGASTESDAFMATPIDGDGEFVFVVKGWCYSEDWYIVRANNVFIKEDYLPYVDKKIPVEILKPFSYPNQLYGISSTDLLIPTVYQIELMLNTLFDYAIYTSNPVLLVDKQDYGDFSRKYEVVDGKPGALLPVSSSSNSVNPLKYPNLNVDIFQGIDRLQKDAVIATQHDPGQLGMMDRYTTATSNIMNKEILDRYIGGILLNFTTGLVNIARMVLSRCHQFMRNVDVETIVQGESEPGEFKIPIAGKSMEIDWDERIIKIEEDPNKVTVINISPDIYEYQNDKGEKLEVTANDYEVELSAESMKMISKAMEQQKIMEAFGQLVPFAVNRQNPQAAMQNPLGMIDAQQLFQEVIDKLELSTSLLISPTEDERGAIKKAERQNMEMYSGERSMPEAGEPQVHIQVHTKFQQHITEVYENLLQDIQNSIMSGMEIEEEKKQEFDRLKVVTQLISEHIDFDMTPSLMESAKVQQKASQVGMPQPGIGQQVSQSGLGGSQAAPNVPQAEGMTGGGPGDMPSRGEMGV